MDTLVQRLTRCYSGLHIQADISRLQAKRTVTEKWTLSRLRNDLLCVEWDVKPYTLTYLLRRGSDV